ncbi:glycosyl hydrolase [Larkinella insperata]|uniref:Glycosyl hydrolase n=1 Tax=Larkinella insperata TaxID=332158 RepID=A0ABW3QBM8_9BACT
MKKPLEWAVRLLFCLTWLQASVVAQGQPVTDQLIRNGFQNPPTQARPKTYWWWLNGHVDTTQLKVEIRAMKEAGIGGVDIFDIGVPAYNNPGNLVKAGPAFMGPESMKAIEMVLREAKRLNMEVGLNLSSSWNAGGSWITPQHAGKSIYVSKQIVAGSSGQPIRLAFPAIPKTDAKGKPLLIEFGADGKPVFHQEIAVVALPVRESNGALDTTRILSLSRYFDPKTEQLNWKVPAGKWEIQRYVCSNSGEPLKLPSPKSMGPIIDHFDSSATRAHFQYFIDRLQPRVGDFRQSALKTLYLASYEATGFVWTPSLPAAFRKLNGYSIDKFLPILFDKTVLNPAQTARFRQDFNRTLSELMIQNHYRKGREIANQYGLLIASEAGGPGPPLHNVPVETLKALGALDVPRGEFWSRYHYYDTDSVDIMWLVKEVAAAAHIYKRRMVEEESFTSFHHWQEGPFDLKSIADRAFCEGMNRVVIHGFSHNPDAGIFPGIVYGAGTHVNTQQTWWSKVKPFNEYLARISHVLQNTDFVADVLYYYGDDVPNFVPPKNTRFRVGPGYDYEIINTDILLNDLSVKNGKLRLSNGATFSVLALGGTATLPPAILKKLNELARKGAVISGPRFSTETPLAHLRKRHIGPDFSYPKSVDSTLDYVHYRQQDTDYYLIRNNTNAWFSTNCSFRQTGKAPEFWNPVTGGITPISIYQQEQAETRLPLTLAPYGSCFIVFKKAKAAPRYSGFAAGQSVPPFEFTPTGIRFFQAGSFSLLEPNKGAEKAITSAITTQELTGPWPVFFPPNWGAPAATTFPRLISWTDSEIPGIRYFSGIGTYQKTFSFSSPVDSLRNERVYLDLGQISEIADVWLNGQHLGITWADPYRFDITKVIKPGENTLKVEVANAWSNRLTGDAITGETFTKTNVSIGYKATPWKQVPLIPSGLLGPVTIQTLKQTP